MFKMERIKSEGTLERLIDFIDVLSEQKGVDTHELNLSIGRLTREFYAENRDNLGNPEFTRHLTQRMNIYLYRKLREKYRKYGKT